jgi:hypothetical protein
MRVMVQDSNGLTGEDLELSSSFRTLKRVSGGVLIAVKNQPRNLLMKIIFALGCAGPWTNAALAQVQIDLGLKGGVNYASVNSKAAVVSTTGGVTDYHAGAYAMFKFGKVFAVQPEIVYSAEGQEYKYSVLGYPSYKSTFNYFNYPLILKFYVAEGLNLQLGPQFGVLHNAKGYTYTPSGNGGPPTIASQPLGDYVNAYNVSLCVGAGWDLPFGLNFTFRYNGGLTNLNKLTTQSSQLPGSPFGTSSANSSVIQFSVGYRLLKFGYTAEY